MTIKARSKACYGLWANMIYRCENKDGRQYPDYGGRGITVCPEWRNSHSKFMEDMGPRPSPRHTIDRIDNDKGYCKENCRWATKKEQSRNRRNNVVITINGISKTLVEWSEQSTCTPEVIRGRINRGWTPERAVNLPSGDGRRLNKTRQKHITINGESRCLQEWLEIKNINRSTYESRVYQKGMSPEEAIMAPVEKREWKNK